MGKKISKLIEELQQQTMPPASDGVVLGSYWLFPDKDDIEADCALRFSQKNKRPIVVVALNSDNSVWVAPITTKEPSQKVCTILCPQDSWRIHNNKPGYMLFNNRIKVKRKCFQEGIANNMGECKNEAIIKRIKEKWGQAPR